MYLIKFIPFHNTPRLIDWNEIEKLEVVKYDPIGDYGGWGIKSKKGKKAYNVSGDIGLKLYLKNGKNILIGTQCEEELREYLKGKNIITLNG